MTTSRDLESSLARIRALRDEARSERSANRLLGSLFDSSTKGKSPGLQPAAKRHQRRPRRSFGEWLLGSDPWGNRNAFRLLICAPFALVLLLAVFAVTGTGWIKVILFGAGVWWAIGQKGNQ